MKPRQPFVQLLQLSQKGANSGRTILEDERDGE